MVHLRGHFLGKGEGVLPGQKMLPKCPHVDVPLDFVVLFCLWLLLLGYDMLFYAMLRLRLRLRQGHKQRQRHRQSQRQRQARDRDRE